MQQYADAVLSPLGAAILGATITVTKAAGGAATLYSGNGTGLLGSNVLTTDSDGAYSFYAANGRYTLTIAASGYGTVTRDVVLNDPADLPLYHSQYAANAAGVASGVMFRAGDDVRVNSGSAVRARRVLARDAGIVLDGTTDGLSGINALIQSVPSGEGIEIVVDGPLYLSAATTNSGRYPSFIFTAGGGVCSTSGGALGSESSRLSWPVRFKRQLPNGYEYDYGTNPPAGSASVRHRYENITGNASVLGSTNAYGIRTDYRSWAYGSGFDIAHATLAIWNRSAGQDGGQLLAEWFVAVSPNVGGASARWGTFACEMNVANRYSDSGWSAKRSPLNNWAGVLQIVPENDDLAGGTDTYNVLYGIVSGPSSENKSDGIPAQVWNAWLMEPNCVCGDGFGIYASGNDTGTSARDPAAFLGLAQTWKTGIDTSAATLTTGRALAMDDGHRIGWMSGGSEVAGIRVGSGSPESVVTAPVGSLYLRTDGGAGTTLYVKQTGTGNTGWAAK